SRMKLPTALTGDVGAANADPIFHARHRKGQDGTHGVSAVSACLGPHPHLRGRWTPLASGCRALRAVGTLTPTASTRPSPESRGKNSHRPPAGWLSRTRRDQPVTAEEQGGHPPGA